MKKKVISIILATAMVVTMLAGCGGSKKDDSGSASTGDSKGDEQITLSVWHIENDATRQEVLKKAIARFEESHPNIKVEQVPMENDPYKTKLSTAMAAGEEPDLFISWGGGWLESFVEEGKVLDINDKIAEVKDNYYDAALSLFEVEGKTYALPYRCGPAPVYYNKDIYAKYKLEVPETMEEFESNMKVLKDNGITPFALGNSSQWPGALAFIWLSLREGGSEAFLNAYNRTNGGTFEDPSFIKAGETIQKWVEEGYYPEGCNGINYDTGGSRMLFYGEQCAHIIQTNAFLSNCKSEDPDFYENKLGLFNYPVIEGTAGKADEILGGGNGYSISQSSEHPEEAFELMLALTDKEYGQDMVDIAGLFTGVKGVTIEEPKTKQVEQMVLNASYIQNFYDQFLPTEMGNLSKQTTYDMFELKITPQKAAEDMEAAAVKDLGPSK
jgi:raffinose/stachyose/melibiose transport system substrate-binding protein